MHDPGTASAGPDKENEPIAIRIGRTIPKAIRNEHQEGIALDEIRKEHEDQSKGMSKNQE